MSLVICRASKITNGLKLKTIFTCTTKLTNVVLESVAKRLGITPAMVVS